MEREAKCSLGASLCSPTAPPHAILKTTSEGDAIIPLLLAFRDLQHCASSQHRPGTWL